VADQTQVAIYAWAWMSNHAHMFMRSGIEKMGDAQILRRNQ
jgi:REP element-mobilizing transposase RayT